MRREETKKQKQKKSIKRVGITNKKESKTVIEICSTVFDLRGYKHKNKNFFLLCKWYEYSKGEEGG